MDPSPTAPQCADPSGRGRRLGTPAHDEKHQDFVPLLLGSRCSASPLDGKRRTRTRCEANRGRRRDDDQNQANPARRMRVCFPVLAIGLRPRAPTPIGEGFYNGQPSFHKAWFSKGDEEGLCPVFSTASGPAFG